MEKSIIDLMAALRRPGSFRMWTCGPILRWVLAYIGDAVYEVVVRSLLVGRGNAQANRLHKEASTLVNAGAQSASLERIREELTEEEMQVFKRGRNANSATMAKHATMSDYRRATGFEALMGYLYLTGRTERILELAKKGLEED